MRSGQSVTPVFFDNACFLSFRLFRPPNAYSFPASIALRPSFSLVFCVPGYLCLGPPPGTAEVPLPFFPPPHRPAVVVVSFTPAAMQQEPLLICCFGGRCEKPPCWCSRVALPRDAGPNGLFLGAASWGGGGFCRQILS